MQEIQWGGIPLQISAARGGETDKSAGHGGDNRRGAAGPVSWKRVQRDLHTTGSVSSLPWDRR